VLNLIIQILKLNGILERVLGASTGINTRILAGLFILLESLPPLNAEAGRIL
jgi:hypothetical protein